MRTVIGNTHWTYEKTGNDTIYYLYDESGSLVGIRYNDNQYYYKKNLQGDIDIIGLLDNNLDEVVKYTYDSWDKVLSITDANGTAITDTNHIGHKNPYRYKDTIMIVKQVYIIYKVDTITQNGEDF